MVISYSIAGTFLNSCAHKWFIILANQFQTVTSQYRFSISFLGALQTQFHQKPKRISTIANFRHVSFYSFTQQKCCDFEKSSDTALVRRKFIWSVEGSTRCSKGELSSFVCALFVICHLYYNTFEDMFMLNGGVLSHTARHHIIQHRALHGEWVVEDETPIVEVTLQPNNWVVGM